MESKRKISILVAMLYAAAAFAFAGGSGTAEDPFQISTIAHLQAVNSNLSSHFILVNDIDLAGESFTNSVIAPYTYWSSPQFTGTFDGCGFVISNLTVTGGENVGFFGRISRPGIVKNLGIENANITAGISVGVLAGYSTGHITDCYATGTVTITGNKGGGLLGSGSTASVSNCYADVNVFGGSIVGGLVGYNSATIIANSYATGDISGTSYVGGLVGDAYQYGYGIIRNCYATGSVSASVSYAGGFVGREQSNSAKTQNCYATGAVDCEGNYAGGFAGNTSGTTANCYALGAVSGVSYVGGFSGSVSGTIRYSYSTGFVEGSGTNIGGFNGFGAPTTTACFWNSQTSNQPTSQVGIPKTTAEMQDINTYTTAGWDFAAEQANGSHDIWYMAANGYPGITYLNSSLKPALQGAGTPENPYQLASVEDILAINWAPSASYELAGNIDFDGINFTNSPVYTFSGTLKGNGFAIENLAIYSSYRYIGLFGIVCPSGFITNLSIDNAVISGANYVGTLAGENRGTIKNCHTSSVVAGSSGGCFVGKNYYGLISNGSSAGSVSCDSQQNSIGGFAGELYYGTVERSWSWATVIGGGSLSPNIGGFAGISSSASVSDSYATGNVGAGTYSCERVGGFIGYFMGTTVNCYSTGLVSGGTNYVGGFAGRALGATATECFWDTQTSKRDTSPCGTGKTTAEMQDIQTFLTAGWDFVNETDNGLMDFWHIQTADYPKLYWQARAGDINYDGDINENDLAVMTSQWLTLPLANQRLAADINENGEVDLLDYSLLAVNWLQ
jgi:hypothetical protein